MKQLQEHSALLQLCDTSHWRSVVGLTFNLKQSIVTASAGIVPLDEVAAKKAFYHYMRDLNRHIYKSAFRHHGKRLKVIPVIEKSAEGRWHYHVAMEPPAFIEGDVFGDIAMRMWCSGYLGYGHGQISTDADTGWISYVAKRRSKCGLDHYFDCIDTEAFYNPLDC